ncbi:hypothetical protein Scep_001342 [Stephania cephalantha]|uniref:Uncharacterized protein n=1 Tax=Stephania cephalantha TaxID=152367 RepID=A0AAP0Q7M4_9MAGN
MWRRRRSRAKASVEATIAQASADGGGRLATQRRVRHSSRRRPAQPVGSGDRRSASGQREHAAAVAWRSDAGVSVAMMVARWRDYGGWRDSGVGATVSAGSGAVRVVARLRRRRDEARDGDVGPIAPRRRDGDSFHFCLIALLGDSYLCNCCWLSGPLARIARESGWEAVCLVLDPGLWISNSRKLSMAVDTLRLQKKDEFDGNFELREFGREEVKRRGGSERDFE